MKSIALSTEKELSLNEMTQITGGQIRPTSPNCDHISDYIDSLIELHDKTDSDDVFTLLSDAIDVHMENC